MKFVEQKKTVTVMGNSLLVKPASWRKVQEVQSARERGDGEEMMRLACEMVSECVTMSDGTPIETDELSVDAITALVRAVAGGGDAAGVADFTGTPG